MEARPLLPGLRVGGGAPGGAKAWPGPAGGGRGAHGGAGNLGDSRWGWLTGEALQDQCQLGECQAEERAGGPGRREDGVLQGSGEAGRHSGKAGPHAEMGLGRP